MKLDRILVPLDGSALAESALSAAVELARPTGATLILVRSAEARVLPGGDPVAAQVGVVREAEAYLEGVAARLREQGTTTAVEPCVWYGPAVAGIVDAARICRVDLIVMTTHGRSGLGGVGAPRDQHAHPAPARPGGAAGPGARHRAGRARSEGVAWLARPAARER
jgi:nucleotide-binding universal stress UspA family protein